MKIEVGDKLTGKWLDNNQIIEEMAVSNDFLQKLYKNIENNKVEILKIERPNWEVVEEKKELLTEEERAFLKVCVKTDNDIYYVQKNKERLFLINKEKTKNVFTINNGNMFKTLEQKTYTLKELRIGGINNGFRF